MLLSTVLEPTTIKRNDENLQIGECNAHTPAEVTINEVMIKGDDMETNIEAECDKGSLIKEDRSA